MSFGIYALARKAFTSWSAAGLAAPIDMATDTIKVALVSSAYTPNLATDQFWSSVSANLLGTAQPLGTKTVSSAGIFSSANPSFTGLPSSGTGKYLVVYKDTGVAGTSPLIALYDGTETVTCAVAAIATNTTVKVDPLTAPIASGTAIVFSGGTTATLSALANAGDRTITVTALAGGIAQGETGPAVTTGANMPITLTSGLTVTDTVDATNGWFKL
ncbi:MAG: hypothetical protein JWQ01_4600 [Massilia sp.]|nr:hypothetical protein [Massilia sp.]